MENNSPKSSPRAVYPLSLVYFYLTEGCNLRCRHCWIEPKFQGPDRAYPALDLDLFQSVIQQAKSLGLTGAKLTGGEPLLHPQIREILRLLRQENISLLVETNGVLCTEDLAREIAAGKDPLVSVSLDGAGAATHEWVRGVEGCFEGALQGIRNLVRAGLRPQIIMTLMRRNREQMAALVRRAESMGAGSVKFNVVQPTARGKAMHRRGETLTIEELVEVGRWVENDLSKSAALPVYYHHPPAFRPLGKMFGPEGGGCGACGILGILGVLADGSYALCGIGETVPEMIFGHAARDRLEDIWNHTPILRELRAGFPHRFEGICGDCILKGLCLGSCVAQNYYHSRNLWAGFWYCDQAETRGLFPNSRIARKPFRGAQAP